MLLIPLVVGAGGLSDDTAGRAIDSVRIATDNDVAAGTKLVVAEQNGTQSLPRNLADAGNGAAYRCSTRYPILITRRSTRSSATGSSRANSRGPYTVRFKWEPGSIAFWDNRSTVHLAPSDLMLEHDRRLYRVTLVGDVPQGPDGRLSVAIAGAPFEAI